MFATKAALVASLLAGARAAPSINVDLRASFGAPPYLIELLETAAEENATSYFPLLDHIADGYFDPAKTDEELYTRFRLLLKEQRHLKDEDLSSFDYALSIHSAAPRIEAHFQYYNTSIQPLATTHQGSDCESWVHVPFSGQSYCSPELEESTARPFGNAADELHELPFDRVLGDPLGQRPSIVYADLGSSSFRKFHKTLSKTAKEGKTSYRLRYRTPADAERKPLTVSGYGVELALKRTDYIVIDDRQAEDGAKESANSASDASLNEEEVSDLRPLSQSELKRLGVKAASFVMGSEKPLDTLLRLSQDFPKHSSSIAATNISHEFLQEHIGNRDVILPPGYNVMWINGVQMMPRDIDAYSLLEYLRRERKMINGVRGIGLSGSEAVNLLSHEAITESQVEQEAQRYDWRDETEGGDVIIWMNDIEKDKRYEEWPEYVSALLQRTFPGQLPSVRKDLHNLVVPVDFAEYTDALLVAEQLRSFVSRKVPIRFGLVPYIRSPATIEQTKIVYYLIDRYGLSAALEYLEDSLESAGKKYGKPDDQQFQAVVESRTLRPNKEILILEEIFDDAELQRRVAGSQAYISRIGSIDPTPPVLVNGVPVARTEDWFQTMSQRVSLDVRMVQQAVYEMKVTDEDYLPNLFLENASIKRNPLVIPEDDSSVRHLNLGELSQFSELPSLSAEKDTIERELVHFTLAADLDSKEGFEQLMEALLLHREHDNLELALLHIPQGGSEGKRIGSGYDTSSGEASLQSLLEQYNTLAAEDRFKPDDKEADFSTRQKIFAELYQRLATDSTPDVDEHARTTWAPFREIVSALGVAPGQKALIVNGRIVGPMSDRLSLDVSDLEALYSYERKKRLLPAAKAIEALGLAEKASTPLAFARISNLIALSLVSDVPEGIFEAAPTVRTDVFKKWNSTHTAIHLGDEKTATIQLYTAVDPASEAAQRWIPIIKVLSELEGVHTKIFLNPRDRLEEIPIKRFYRQVLSSKPTFEADGSLRGNGAQFSGLPAEALLNLGMDLPPAWLVAPKETIYDPDNIKLSLVKSGNIDATYELRNILIEGHSRDPTAGGIPPRGAQLVLGTEHDHHFADTIIMANLGYFQFKANPGLYNLALQKGRSEKIFHIDSAGTRGHAAALGDNTTEIALMSFRGATIYPRISRKPGMDDEDVLEPAKSALESVAEGADKLLAQVGLKSPQTSKYLFKAAKLGSGLLSGSSKTDISVDHHADINIFSVASGHLYERMLNIMMVSVMKHTKHSVKFWFIEQFLSPSFKDFLPTMAEEYGFKYEMVTYKWPHWLRAQKEKQREIWGYKILFLDVLFPLDLDKVIFVDADQIVRTDMYELVQHDLKGAPYGFTPMCDSRTEMEGFRFWKQGYWKNFLKGLPYHISALYVVDLKRFRQLAAGDRLRQNYHQLSADPNSLSNLDQDLPNHMQSLLPIHSLPQEWLWCETWCSDESLKEAKTIDLCNNPQTKEPKLDRARRQVPEWTEYDNEIAVVAKRHKEQRSAENKAHEAGLPDVHDGNLEEESIQERLQREDAERERKKKEKGHDEL
ncbi:UDP-glucose:glycoprotein glucosyltransferase [Fulvia fulva]|uniref:UDP-glucose:glycoprotein glucosyltransferase n=1 Tax=Passalora fulva TaxID=5499 RepID=A0A9Q8UTG4_PASFU|nr:UDP-glucose:glycoprotein glucosyltransferase [Fulvia fulva]KAK4613296.1 UDP-glucose:glycoprotein glucosyltransferase [Fulvia fulva]UJO21924.1 UDP-glucose:glycoprotein glucosyltransferase [Fulvia fulva]WPV19930.1 UDP-glucose:glycoprotein glucosyltransferase [Fulvia fulva]WPV35018.1 UDP-glucose:glycoprotein glucosyltransferase [Fulvia fulva]